MFSLEEEKFSSSFVIQVIMSNEKLKLRTIATSKLISAYILGLWRSQVALKCSYVLQQKLWNWRSRVPYWERSKCILNLLKWLYLGSLYNLFTWLAFFGSLLETPKPFYPSSIIFIKVYEYKKMMSMLTRQYWWFYLWVDIFYCFCVIFYLTEHH